MNFDALVEKLDNAQQKAFAVDVVIDGTPTKGIFDEDYDQFEGVDTMYHTLELPLSDLPLGVENDESIVLLSASGRSFTIHRIKQFGENVILELDEN